MMSQREAEDGTLVRRRITFTATRRRLLSMRPGGRSALRVPCPICGTEVEVVTPEEAREILRIEEDTLRRLVDTRLVHAIRAVNGALWICKPSLFPEARP
jgi:hypothetical protein